VAVRVAVLDIGSNTIKLLVADVGSGGVEAVDTGRVRLALGAEIEQHGVVSATSIRAAAKAVKKLRSLAASHGVDEVDVFLTAPGRQAANADELVAAVQPARVLSTQEEGRLAYLGALATCDDRLSGAVAVCDVGGASTEIAVGTRRTEPTWLESVDIGSVRLTTRAPAPADAAREAVAAFAAVQPPRVDAALAVGGSARAARRLVGPWLGAAELAEALHLVETLDTREVNRRFGVDRARAETLSGGIAILAEVQRLLHVPLHVCDGGIREGAALRHRAALAA
jgi:exopolyphosphatase/guanosine-5'-triphosphate,3'-diphosphate pyrophosphatase